jgi:hypothetical protein
MGPVTAPAGTVAAMVVSSVTLNVVAATPPNVTPVAPTNPLPVIVTEVPTRPEVGVKSLTMAAACAAEGHATKPIAVRKAMMTTDLRKMSPPPNRT